jgi:hypothetical protein
MPNRQIYQKFMRAWRPGARLYFLIGGSNLDDRHSAESISVYHETRNRYHLSDSEMEMLIGMSPTKLKALRDSRPEHLKGRSPVQKILESWKRLGLPNRISIEPNPREEWCVERLIGESGENGARRARSLAKLLVRYGAARIDGEGYIELIRGSQLFDPGYQAVLERELDNLCHYLDRMSERLELSLEETTPEFRAKSVRGYNAPDR